MARNLSSLVTVYLAGLLLAMPAKARISAWLDFDGAIKGEALETNHKDWIEIHGFMIGSSRQVAKTVDGSREPNAAQVSELALSKSVDRATPELFRSIVGGRGAFPKATLDLTTGGATPFARLILENVWVTEQSFAAALGGDRPSESISLNFEKITYIYVLPDGDSLYTKYDIAKSESKSGILPGTDPDADSDGDGMPDWWETEYGLSVWIDDSGLDADGDGLSNRQEYELGTNPRSGTSFFKATLEPDAEAPGSYQITWNSVPGKAYVIEWSPDLVTPFTAVRSVVAATSNTTETVAGAGTVGFYRFRPQ